MSSQNTQRALYFSQGALDGVRMVQTGIRAICNDTNLNDQEIILKIMSELIRWETLAQASTGIFARKVRKNSNLRRKVKMNWNKKIGNENIGLEIGISTTDEDEDEFEVEADPDLKEVFKSLSTETLLYLRAQRVEGNKIRISQVRGE